MTEIKPLKSTKYGALFGGKGEVQRVANSSLL